MEHAQKIRFFAPQFTVKSFNVEQRLYDGKLIDMVCNGKLESTGNGAPLNNSVVEEFANCRIDMDAIKRFIYQFGPLYTSTDGKVFGFQLTDWASMRHVFRTTWGHMIGLAPRDQDLGWMPDNLKTLLQQKPEPCTRVEIKGGAFELTDAGLVYVADSLYGALVLKLFSLSEGKKLRRCLKPDCDCRPYFIADHGRQQYCSENCAAWAQTQFKKKWWAKEGPHWREQQAKQKKQLSRNRKRPSGKVENRGTEKAR